MNKKPFLILFFLILFSNNIFCQFRNVVSRNERQHTVVSISLFKNGKYLIMINSGTDDVRMLSDLSMGNYVYNKDTVTCTDAYYNYSLKFLRQKDELIPIKSFPYMMGHTFDSYGISDFYEEYETASNFFISYYKPLVCEENQQTHKLRYGKYGGDLSLILKKDNYYACKIDDLIISEGTFVDNENCITFYDKHLDFSFYGTVGHNSVCVGFLPFQNDCLTFDYDSVEKNTEKSLKKQKPFLFISITGIIIAIVLLLGMKNIKKLKI